MSSTASPFGLRAVIKEGGTPVSLLAAGTIASGYGTAIGSGDPVKLLAGNLVRAVGTNAGDATGGIIGMFDSVTYLDSNGKPVKTNYWVASTVATNIIAYYVRDPYTIFEVQANATLAASSIGSELDFVSPTQNALTGLSTTAADASTLSTGAQRLLRIVGLTPGVDNAWGDSFPIIQVQIAKHQWVTPVVGVA